MVLLSEYYPFDSNFFKHATIIEYGEIYICGNSLTFYLNIKKFIGM